MEQLAAWYVENKNLFDGLGVVVIVGVFTWLAQRFKKKKKSESADAGTIVTTPVPPLMPVVAKAQRPRSERPRPSALSFSHILTNVTNSPGSSFGYYGTVVWWDMQYSHAAISKSDRVS